ncbi:MAG: pyridoxamine 5'-phosphate oxidase family protein [Gammaproteobacteria bacterium]|uniref:pyridoxamine 5'-phosphate oxidase family protein n=1 Tax=Rhodoferax sp. TaxID=50421 RepID=UPI001832E741|nr:pyridoxamine 5'-phosphate oxidase family protein [Rhodoferax sp.]MBU3900310.1 pyridoxamine 5'-phosphate oxidase family protein [Gammaproteobacteria bacterium]MBA3057162.1 hypothetical protein [Rhodoferax sp.]MBU3997904.1 pyridoxamine 5'-phosphate oxidase family protein [Gammaproteobacteria bacterium]MBU4079352.1 pyridoxamine 5'-phosphate oxidase family protein [Gammaproteobacteria bacterium]MBU4111757.1 pyridoxamine 5'-phosphate oxidase family protein [Gammaproteobacteria bacterium]
MKTPLLTEAELRHQIWHELQRATQDRQHEWRTPVLATIGAQGGPQARTVVLRHSNATLERLTFYTDRRSPKVAELAANSGVTLVFWSKRLGWQLRVQADMSAQTTGPEVEQAWAQVSQSAAAGDYLSASAPGDALPIAPGMPGIQTSAHHLAVLTAQVQHIDWLELGRSGHRRAVFGANTWEWRVP